MFGLSGMFENAPVNKNSNSSSGDDGSNSNSSHSTPTSNTGSSGSSSNSSSVSSHTPSESSHTSSESSIEELEQVAVPGWHPTTYRVLQWNLRSGSTNKNVLDELVVLIQEALSSSSPIDIICLCETWDDSNVTNSKTKKTVVNYANVLSHGYDVLKCSRREKRDPNNAGNFVSGGGVALLYRRARFKAARQFAGNQATELAKIHPFVEYVAARLHPTDAISPSVCIASLYLTPGSDGKRDKETRLAMMTSLSWLYDALRCDAMFADWNAGNHTSWSKVNVLATDPTTYTGAAELLSFITKKDLRVSSPFVSTRFDGNATLDFGILNSDVFAQVESCYVIKGESTSSGSDHLPVHHILNTFPLPILNPGHLNAGYKRKKVRSVAWSVVKPHHVAAAQSKFNKLVKNAPAEGVNGRCRYFLKMLQFGMDSLPRLSASQRMSQALPPDVTKARRASILSWSKVATLTAKLDTLLDRVGDDLTAQTQQESEAIVNLETERDEAIVAATKCGEVLGEQCKKYSNRFYQVNETEKGDDNALWKVFKRITADPPPNRVIQPTADSQERWTTSQAQADGFAKMMQAKHKMKPDLPATDYDIEPDAMTEEAIEKYLRNVDTRAVPEFTITEVLTALKENKKTGCADLYGIDAKLLNLLTLDAVTYLADFYTEILRKNKIPKCFLLAIISPILKNGKIDYIALGYRPISVTLLLCRTLERVTKRRMLMSITINPHQFGFRAGGSTLEPLLLTVLSIRDGFLRSYTHNEVSRQFRTMELNADLTDAFCRVMNQHVIEGLKNCNGDPLYAPFIKLLMSGRKMRVKVDSSYSETLPLDVGAGQGGVLSPLFFVLACDSVISALVRKTDALQSVRNSYVGFPPPNDAALKNSLGLNYRAHGTRSGNRNQTDKIHFSNLFFFADDNSEFATGYNADTCFTHIARMGDFLAKMFARRGIDISTKSTGQMFCSTLHPDEKILLQSREIEMNDSLSVPVKWRTEKSLTSSKASKTATAAAAAAVTPPTAEVEPAMKSTSVDEMKLTRQLGLYLDAPLSFNFHVATVCRSATYYLHKISALRTFWSTSDIRKLYLATSFAVLTYAGPVFYPMLSNKLKLKLEAVHNAGARLITGCCQSTPSTSVLAEAGLRPLGVMIKLSAFKFIEKLKRRPYDPQPQHRHSFRDKKSCPALVRFLLVPEEDANREGMQAVNARFNTTLRSWNSNRGDLAPKRQECEELTCHNPSLRIDPDSTGRAHLVKFMENDSKKKKKEMTHSEQHLYNKIRYDALPCPRWQLLSDGSVELAKDTGFATKAAYAAVLEFVDEHGKQHQIEDEHGRCSRFSCSYTAESHGVQIALKLLSDSLATLDSRAVRNFTLPEGALPVVLLTDCNSVIQKLNGGPLAQTELVPTKCWEHLIQLLSFCSGKVSTITLCFLFSHCNFAVHNKIDKEASKAWELTENDGNKHYAKVNVADSIRLSVRALKKETDTATLDAQTFRNCHLPRKLNSQDIVSSYACMTSFVNDLPWNQAATIYRLRTGVDLDLPGCKKRFETTCRSCQTVLSREAHRENGVKHMFSCKSNLLLRQRIFGSDITPAVLWSEDKSDLEKVLQLKEKYLEDWTFVATLCEGAEENEEVEAEIEEEDEAEIEDENENEEEDE